MFSICGKVALITGGVKGIGLEFAKALLRQNLKAVALVDVDGVTAQSALVEIEAEFGKKRAIFIKADVTNKDTFKDAFESTVQTFKQLDIVVNNAGILHEIQPEKCVQVNLVGVIWGTTLAMEEYLPKYKSSHEGVILNVSSKAAFTSYEGLPTYVATKHAVVAFSRSVGGPIHYKMYKVRVVTICPGTTDTNIFTGLEERIREPFRSAWLNRIDFATAQKANQVAEKAIKLIESAPTGTVWSITDNILLERQAKY